VSELRNLGFAALAGAGIGYALARKTKPAPEPEGPTLQVQDGSTFGDVMHWLVDRGWCVRIENPGEKPIEIAVSASVGEFLIGRLYDEAKEDWIGEELRIPLDQDVKVTIL
jgi:hypothetical protein